MTLNVEARGTRVGADEKSSADQVVSGEAVLCAAGTALHEWSAPGDGENAALATDAPRRETGTE